MSITSRSERVNLRIGLIQTVHLEVPFSIKKRVCFGHEFCHDASRFDYQARALAAVCEMRMRS